tara:strand:+ start:158 stop:538 length:381 start_codon:yes stop_codon:yes gene_type:complete
MGTRRRRMRSHRRMRKLNRHRMNPPGYVEYPLPPIYSNTAPGSLASQIEEYLATIVMLQNRVNMLEDLLERSQESFDRRLEQLQLENETLVQELAMAGLGRPQVESAQMDDDEDEAFAEFLAAQDS